MAGKALTLEQAARRIGRYRWVEMRTFEVLGQWVPTVPEARVKERLASHSRKHAWHAQLWHDLLVVAGADPVELTQPPGPALADFLDAVSGPTGPVDTVERLVGVYRVLVPHKIAVYTDHLEHASAVAEGPTMRWLRFVLQDEVADRNEGERLLRQLVESPEQAERAADHQVRLEILLAESGGIGGPAGPGDKWAGQGHEATASKSL